MISPADINRTFGNIDLFLLDQLLKQNIPEGKLLDAGCGEGRNLKYFCDSNTPYEVYGIDSYEEAIKMAQLLFKESQFSVSSIEEKPFPNSTFDIVLCINVLHHAKDVDHFNVIIDALFDILKTEGVLFLRTLVTDGPSTLENEVFHISENVLHEILKPKFSFIDPYRAESGNFGRLSVCCLKKL